MNNIEIMRKALQSLQECEPSAVATNDASRRRVSAIDDLRTMLSFYDAKPEDVIRKVGSQAKFAEELGVSQQAVSHWCKQGSIPRKHHGYILSWWGLI